MPEGPEIRRAADQVQHALQGRRLIQVAFGLDHLTACAKPLEGHCVSSVDTWGKAMLTRFDNGMTLYTHNQLYGRWYVGDADLNPRTDRKLRAAFRTEQTAALLYSASTIELLTPQLLKQHPFLSKLGPDVLHTSTATEQIIQQLMGISFRKRQLGYLLTDQTCLAGLGNYLRCETLFDAQLSPTLRPVDCSDQQLERLAQSLLTLTRQSYTSSGITNDISLAKHLIEQGTPFEQARFYVFRRNGLPCYRCGQPIEKIKHSSQTCYICRTCQTHGE
ncbi:MAG: endonuclease VIII [Sedimenticola sp.]|nr:endonuclease VIII [Sedimenticola sp.]